MTTDATSGSIAHTCHGDVRGLATENGGAVFAGVPFASPPVGALRWRPPQPPKSWSGVREATEFLGGPAQRSIRQGMAVFADDGSDASDPRRAAMLAARRHMDETSSEDCLYLNVWTPSLAGSHPVVVWMFGGGFETGSASPPAFDGAALSRLTGALVVAANYRVGALGYLLPTGPDREEWVDSANLGLQDQAAALMWVRENVAAFGGDANNVTIAGGSAGAFSVGALLALPAVAGTFHKAILHSGSTSRIYPVESVTALAHDLMTAVGVRTMHELAAAPLDRILDAQNAVNDRDMGRRSLPGGRAWGPVLDGRVLTGHPLDAVAAGVTADIPLLLGANRDEFRAFESIGGEAYRPRDEQALLSEIANAGVLQPKALLDAYRARLATAPFRREGIDELTALRTLFLSDAVYRVPVTRLARAQTAAGGRAHNYLFAGEPFGPSAGSGHSAESIYLFDKLAAAGIDTSDHRGIRDGLVAAWTAFITDGDPGWPAYDPAAVDNARQFGGGVGAVTEPPLDVAPFWDNGQMR
ncbi:carboxylesterase/lipase family protein [Streptomyces shenzhenensis]|uniref:carboxylesterase/lipase family protein n=1 Tax=Streptomyces shenzhenensis TaxID=943815 RepID=UPI002867B48E|nr:carboxylesterase family protein [Streptomyces shenzhenensis]